MDKAKKIGVKIFVYGYDFYNYHIHFPDYLGNHVSI